MKAAIFPPYYELIIEQARSSGPGGQNVNKVNSKAIIRWNARASRWLSNEVRTRVLSYLGPRLTLKGELRIACDESRSFHRNRDLCLKRLADILTQAMKVKKKRLPTQISYSKVVKRKQAKTRRARVKALRRRPGPDAGGDE